MQKKHRKISSSFEESEVDENEEIKLKESIDQNDLDLLRGKPYT